MPEYPLDSWSRSDVKHRFALKIEKFQEKHNASMASTNQYSCSSSFTIQGPNNKKIKWFITVGRTVPAKLGVQAWIYIFMGNVGNFDVYAEFKVSSKNTHKIKTNTDINGRFDNYRGGLAEGHIHYSTLTSPAS